MGLLLCLLFRSWIGLVKAAEKLLLSAASGSHPSGWLGVNRVRHGTPAQRLWNGADWKTIKFLLLIYDASLGFSGAIAGMVLAPSRVFVEEITHSKVVFPAYMDGGRGVN